LAALDIYLLLQLLMAGCFVGAAITRDPLMMAMFAVCAALYGGLSFMDRKKRDDLAKVHAELAELRDKINAMTLGGFGR
jgi:hypothetical protein